MLEFLHVNVYTVEDLVSGVEFNAHASRLKYYDDASLNVTEELIEYILDAQAGFEVSRLHSLRFNTVLKQWEILTSWFGFESDADSWEPVSMLLEDCPTLVKKFVKSKKVSVAQRKKLHDAFPSAKFSR